MRIESDAGALASAAMSMLLRGRAPPQARPFVPPMPERPRIALARLSARCSRLPAFSRRSPWYPPPTCALAGHRLSRPRALTGARRRRQPQPCSALPPRRRAGVNGRARRGGCARPMEAGVGRRHPMRRAMAPAAAHAMFAAAVARRPPQTRAQCARLASLQHVCARTL